ncbi:MAG: tripartite tricarboxylate transporter TctB family protein [Pseudomonadota bacterium]
MSEAADPGKGEDRAAARRMASADVLTAVVLLAMGVAMVYGGFAMDRLEVRRIHPMSIPGLVPMMLGAALTVCSLILLANGVRARSALGAGEGALDGLGWGQVARLGLCLMITLTYPLGLIGNMPFWLATSLFVTVFIAVFEWRPRTGAGHGIALFTAVLQGVLVGLVTAYVFQELFLVRLP